jgi:1-carboxybiuret hydrolase subunit AtzG-like protein
MATPPPSPTVTDEAIAAHVDAALALNGIAMAPEWRDSVLANFKTITAAAQFVMAFPLDDEAEPGPVFRP